MRRYVCVLPAAAALMALACGGSLSFNTTAPPTTAEGPALKDNQVKAYLLNSDGKAGTLTVDEGGVQKTYKLDHPKWYDRYEDKVATGGFNSMRGTDAILTLDKQDGKEVVTEIREAPVSNGPSSKGTQVEGKYLGIDYKKDPDGTIHLEVNGEKRDYPLSKTVRRYSGFGPVTPDRDVVSVGQKALVVVEPVGGADRVTEIWARDN